MNLYEQLINAFPELALKDSKFWAESIILQDDSDGNGAYIAKWEYDKPIPAGLKLGKG